MRELQLELDLEMEPGLEMELELELAGGATIAMSSSRSAPWSQPKRPCIAR